MQCLKNALKILLPALLILSGQSAEAQCNPDVTPPIAVCNDMIYVSLMPGGFMQFTASMIDENSYDACCLGDLKIKRHVDGPCDADMAPDTFASEITLCCADIDTTIIMVLQVSDCSGNKTLCWGTVIVEDKVGPTCEAPPNVVTVCSDYDPDFTAFDPPNVYDGCCLDTVIHEIDMSDFNEACHTGVITRTFKAYDCNGNSSQCTQQITFTTEQAYSVQFPDDVVLSASDSLGNYGTPNFIGIDCEQLSDNYSDEVFFVFDQNMIRIERTWEIINWCYLQFSGEIVTVPNPQPFAGPTHPGNLSGPIVSAAGTPAPWAPTVSKINPWDAQPTDFSVYYSPDKLGYQYTQYIYITDTLLGGVTGLVFSDVQNNCSLDTNDTPLLEWPLRIRGLVSGLEFTVFTDSTGHYSRYLPEEDTLVEVSVLNAVGATQNCVLVDTVSIQGGVVGVLNMPVTLPQDCPLIAVDVAFPLARRCFTNSAWVSACNQSGLLIEDASLTLTLDPYITLLNTNIPGVDLGNQQWSFPIGDLTGGECRQLQLHFTISCDAPLGATHCIEAQAFPDTLCPSQANWSGADVRVSGFCDGDTVRLRIANMGAGDMSDPQEFVVVEDVIMYQQGTFMLNAGQNLDLSIPANGATWRLEAEQAPFHPFGGPEAVALEGCGGIQQLGLVNMFPLNSPNPFSAVVCRENVGSWDPNDKSALPVGYTDDHLIEPNTDIQYQIRFQNTGTDTAFNVVILDTLSAQLDALSVRVGASSHPYGFELLDGNILRFTFPNIMLPDSNVNEPASNGFVQFSIRQQADNPDGTRIDNKAAIYFDFNGPVITNEVFHTVGRQFVIVGLDPGPFQASVKAYPNPARDAVYFDLPAATGLFTLYDPLGKIIATRALNNPGFRLERGDLPNGLYYFRFDLDGIGAVSGTIVLK